MLEKELKKLTSTFCEGTFSDPKLLRPKILLKNSLPVHGLLQPSQGDQCQEFPNLNPKSDKINEEGAIMIKLKEKLINYITKITVYINLSKIHMILIVIPEI